MLKPKSDAAMLLLHMVIARATRVEDCHTHPADMSPAAPARHMIAPLRLLHRCRAFRTIFDVKFSLQPLECLDATRCNVFVFCTRVVAMSRVAGGAERLETVWTDVCWRLRARGCGAPIDVFTIWGWAVVEGFGVTLDVLFEGRFEDDFEDG